MVTFIKCNNCKKQTTATRNKCPNCGQIFYCKPLISGVGENKK